MSFYWKEELPHLSTICLLVYISIDTWVPILLNGLQPITIIIYMIPRTSQIRPDETPTGWLVSFWHAFIITWALPYYLCTTRCSRFIVNSPPPALESAISKELQFVLVEVVLETISGCKVLVLYPWCSQALPPFQWTLMGNNAHLAP